MIQRTAFSCLNSISLYIPLKNSIKQFYLFYCDKRQLFLESAQDAEIPAYLPSVRGVMPAISDICEILTF